jgi:hypothetical protein
MLPQSGNTPLAQRHHAPKAYIMPLGFFKELLYYPGVFFFHNAVNGNDRMVKK